MTAGHAPQWTFLDPKQYDVPLLAQAWMALVPPQKGMVVRTTWGKRAVLDGGEDVAGSWYVDLDSPANWGHWLAWALKRELSVEVVPQMPSGSGQLAINIDRLDHITGSFAEAFLRAIIATVVDPSDAAGLPPSVLAWWKEHGQ